MHTNNSIVLRLVAGYVLYHRRLREAWTDTIHMYTLSGVARGHLLTKDISRAHTLQALYQHLPWSSQLPHASRAHTSAVHSRQLNQTLTQH